jgi:hypothetical protein
MWAKFMSEIFNILIIPKENIKLENGVIGANRK